MSDWPRLSVFNPPPQVVGTLSVDQPAGGAVRGTSITTATGVWPTANKAIYAPVDISEEIIVTGIGWFNHSAVSGNIDVGIYDAGTLARLVSTGSTAQSGTSAFQSVNIADTTLPPGHYYVAVAMDNTTGGIARAAIPALLGTCLGAKEQLTAFVLPSTATPVAITVAQIPDVTLLLSATF